VLVVFAVVRSGFTCLYINISTSCCMYIYVYVEKNVPFLLRSYSRTCRVLHPNVLFLQCWQIRAIHLDRFNRSDGFKIVRTTTDELKL